MNLLSQVEDRRPKEAFNLGNQQPVYFWEFSGYPHPSKVHTYEVHNVIFGISGSAKLVTDSGEYQLGANTVLITAPHTPRVFAKRDDYCGGSVLYLTEWLLGGSLMKEEKTLSYLFLGTTLFPKMPRPPITVFSMAPGTREFLRHCLEEIRRESTSVQPSLFEVRLIFLRFLHRLARDYESEHGGLPWDDFRVEVWKAISHIEYLVREHRPFDSEGLAEHSGCSSSYLQHLFQSATGTSPMAYYQTRRMQYAALLLLKSEDSVTQIAYQVGCADAAHFARLFHREMKMTPSAYRKAYNSQSAD